MAGRAEEVMVFRQCVVQVGLAFRINLYFPPAVCLYHDIDHYYCYYAGDCLQVEVLCYFNIPILGYIVE